MAEGEGGSKGIARNPLYAQTHKLEPPSPIMAVWSRVVALGPAVVLTGLLQVGTYLVEAIP